MSAERDRADSEWRAAVWHTYGRQCARCPRPATEIAHIMRRSYQRTRCHILNGRPLCQRCHAQQHAGQWEWWEVIGREPYERLRARAMDPLWKRPPDWWTQVRAHLRSEHRLELL